MYYSCCSFVLSVKLSASKLASLFSLIDAHVISIMRLLSFKFFLLRTCPCYYDISQNHVSKMNLTITFFPKIVLIHARAYADWYPKTLSLGKQGS